jgi:hypothetical protein
MVLATGFVACGLDLAGEQLVDPTAGGDGLGDDGGALTEVDASATNGNGGHFVGSSGGSGGTGGLGAPANLGDGATSASDAAVVACDFSGTWATLVTVDVSWAPAGLNIQTFVLAPGTGTIKQWVKATRVQQGTKLVDTTVVCGIELPDFRGTQVVAGQTYGVVFPDSLFDDGGLPTFEIDETVSRSSTGATFTASASAALLGLTMANPTTDPWPATVTTATDPDGDGTPGVTVDVAQGPLPPTDDGGVYASIPVAIPAPFQPIVVAQRLHLAIRQVTEVRGTVVDCDHVSGTASIPQIAGAYAINSHVVGCDVLDGGACMDTQASFVDNTQPVFTPSGATSFTSMRLPPGTTCATVRSTLK